MSDEIPDNFICPISQDIMENPVIDSCGHYFEKQNILDWLD